MKKNKTILLSAVAIALFSLTFISGCQDDDDTLTGRAAILGTYDFTNNYTVFEWNNSLQKFDTVTGTQTYVISIDKPNPDTAGENVVIVSNLLKKQSTIPVQATLSSAGDVLSYTGDWSVLEFYSFQGIKTGNSIAFNFAVYGSGPSNISELGNGTAVKR